MLGKDSKKNIQFPVQKQGTPSVVVLEDFFNEEFIREEFNQNDEKIEKWLTRWMAGGLTECDEILSNLNSQLIKKTF